jgi:class 3 adenylate cyclase
MEPRIQYAQTADGVSIAFWTLGEGMPFVDMPPVPFSHAQLEWQLPEIRHWYERLAKNRRVIRYDGRGTGMSDRDIPDLSLDSLVSDLEAVTDYLALPQFVIFAPFNSGPLAIAYASRHPDRVARLVLWCTYARGTDAFHSPFMRAQRAIVDLDWHLFAEAAAHDRMGWSVGEPALRFAELIRESVTPEAQKAFMDMLAEIDVTDLLPHVKAPTLVLHRRRFGWLTVDVAKDLACRIPGARLGLLEGASLAPYLEDHGSVVAAINEFLGLGEEMTTGAGAALTEAGGLVIILFTDMEGSTVFTQRLGDAKAQEVLRIHNCIVRDALKAQSGTEVKHTGDGIMASFASASRALECAIAIQRALAQHNESNPDSPIRVRIGLNAGEPVAEERDLFGTAVQLAARICAHAEPGEILVPIVVKELAAGKGFLLADRGDVALRGFEDPVRLYEVRSRED